MLTDLHVDELAVRRAALALEQNPAWITLRDALLADRERLRRQLESLPLDASMETVRYIAGQMRGLSMVIDKPQRVKVAEKGPGPPSGNYFNWKEEVR